jgi:hypothetical protein
MVKHKSKFENPRFFTPGYRPSAPKVTKEIRPIVDQTGNISVEQLIARVGVQMPQPFEDDSTDDFDKYDAKYAYSADLSVLGDQITAAYGKVPSYPRGGSANQRRGDSLKVSAPEVPPSPRVVNSGSAAASAPVAPSAGQPLSPASSGLSAQ